MKKRSVYVILLLLVSVLAISGTYAFLTALAESNNAINTGSHQLQVEYSGDVQISGNIELVKAKEEGFRRELSIGLKTNSVPAAANFFIRVDNISQGFQIDALKWEIYEIINNNESYINSGTFKNITSNTTNYIAENISLSTATRKFAVYLWLDGKDATNDVIGAQLSGYIGADTEKISGDLTK